MFLSDSKDISNNPVIFKWAKDMNIWSAKK